MKDREKKIEELKAQLKEKAEYEKTHKVERITELFNNLEPFTDCDSIPDIPILEDKELYNNVVVKNLIRCGAIPKAELKPHARYLGSCRNATEAEWTGENFIYCRHKWGTEYIDDINHFEDDDGYGYDLFVPIKEIEEC